MAKAKPAKKKASISKKALPKKKGPRKVVQTKGAKSAGLGSSSRVHAYELFGNTRPVPIPASLGPSFYCVLEAATPKDLAFLVQTQMNEAWIPTGGIGNRESGFFQAMIKY